MRYYESSVPHSVPLLVVAIAVPVVGMVLLRVNAAMVFLSLCLGQILVQYVAPQANDLLHMLDSRAGGLSTTTIDLALLLAPAVATAILMLFSVHGGLKRLLNLVPAVAASLLAVLLAGPLLPTNLRHSFHSHQLWVYVSNAQALIVGAGAAVSLFFLWSQRNSLRAPEKRSRRKD